MVDGVPMAVAAAWALPEPLRRPGRLPANAPDVPDGSLEATGAADHPTPRVGLHALSPPSREDRREESLEEAHTRFPFDDERLPRVSQLR